MSTQNNNQVPTFQGEEAITEKRKKEQEECAEDLGDVLGDIIGVPVNRNIAIEFECGGCCKKVSNGQFIDVSECFVTLRPAPGQQLLIRLFCGGVVANRERAQVIVIPIDHIASIEFGSVEVG